ncbi:MAG TPA: glycosyltransferase [Chitinophagaceae bacterium]|nr:glycosyltransferase [Chitinophagaceae bacterium]
MQSDKKRNKPVSIYFIVPAPSGISPGQRFRYEHYLSTLAEKKIKFRVSNFYTRRGWSALYRSGNKMTKAWHVVKGFCKRIIDLFRMGGYSYVYVYREATPLGPPVFEKLIAKFLGKKIIYDFDDAIWVPVTSEFNKGISNLKNFSKVARICEWSYKVSVGNEFLARYARGFNQNTFIIPTVVNTDSVHNQLQQQETSAPAIGWTGTFSTLKYLEIVLPVLQKLQEKADFTFIVIADKDPKLPLKRYEFIKWTKDKEMADLLHFHIGLMPLYDDEISKGKCGFKAIQYMSLGIPAVVSPVGVNTEIVENAVNGFVCTESAEWSQKLEQLLNDSSLRKKLGIAARKKIETTYSVKATTQDFLKLFT